MVHSLALSVLVMQCRHLLNLNRALAILVKCIVVGLCVLTSSVELRNVWTSAREPFLV